jgi:hypothetical protein
MSLYYGDLRKETFPTYSSSSARRRSCLVKTLGLMDHLAAAIPRDAIQPHRRKYIPQRRVMPRLLIMMMLEYTICSFYLVYLRSCPVPFPTSHRFPNLSCGTAVISERSSSES